MTTKDDGGPAFPGPTFSHGGHATGHSMGMTLRDWFAGQALAGIQAGYFAGLFAPGGSSEPLPELTPDHFATMSFKMADAMLAARK